MGAAVMLADTSGYRVEPSVGWLIQRKGGRWEAGRCGELLGPLLVQVVCLDGTSWVLVGEEKRVKEPLDPRIPQKKNSKRSRGV